LNLQSSDYKADVLISRPPSLDKRNNLTNLHNNIKILVAIYRRHRHAELNSQASTQGCSTLQLTYAHSHQGSVSSARTASSPPSNACKMSGCTLRTAALSNDRHNMLNVYLEIGHIPPRGDQLFVRQRDIRAASTALDDLRLVGKTKQQRDSDQLPSATALCRPISIYIWNPAQRQQSVHQCHKIWCYNVNVFFYEVNW